MEDSVTESEMKREIERKQGDSEEEVVSSKRDEEMREEEGGFINHFISKSREIYEGRTDHGGEKMEEEEEEVHSGEGVIDKISNFFHQENEGEEREMKRGKRNEEVDEEMKDSGKKDLELDNGGAGAGGGGRINNLISNFFHQNEDENGGGEEKGTDSDEEQKSKMKGEGENGGIINSLVSNLTASLPEKSVPASDEASILIHSIIHD